MGSKEIPDVAPWLQGLDTAWEEVSPPVDIPISHESPASRDGSVVRNTVSRIPRRSLSGLHSSLASRKAVSQSSAQKSRNPLATLTTSESNTLRRHEPITRPSGTRSVSESSDGSVVRYSTVQQRAKSSSPAKAEMEWKKRLLNGQVPFGDQTELFGPSGLDNIFANPRGNENSSGPKKHNMSWLDRSELTPMPSSPPPWPTTAKPTIASAQRESGLKGAKAGSAARNNSVRFASRSENVPGQSAASSSPQLHSRRSSVQRPRPSNSVSKITKASGDVTHDDIGANRTIGGLTELEQEDFSPVFVSKHTTAGGRIDYKALDSHAMRQLQGSTTNSPRASLTEHAAPSVAALDESNHEEDRSSFTDGPSSDSSAPGPDFSLSENLPTGTPPSIALLGDNVEVKRGGYSRVGSFRHRDLSPSQSTADTTATTHAPQPLSPLETSILPPSKISEPRLAPATPAQDITGLQPKSRSSGSPLKLFGPHDTFTNNRLLRRMSQLDPGPEFGGTDTKTEESSEKSHPILANTGETARQASSASFGNGDLDRHSFDAEITLVSASESSNEDSDRSPGSEIVAPGSHAPLNFRFDISPAPKDTFKLKRGYAQRNKGQSRRSSPSEAFSDRDHSTQEPSHVQKVIPSQSDAENNYQRGSPSGSGKRPPTTPRKDSTPKRRRTLHVSELLESEAAEKTTLSHKQLQEVISSRKRKDARKGTEMVLADPDILAQRKLLRPRNPTPSQRRRERIESEIREAAEEFASQEPARLEAVLEQIESSMASGSPPSMQHQARVVANEVAQFSLRIQRASGDQSQRKRSVTTQDFFNEAVMVMKLIREKAGRQSALGSVVESDQEGLRNSQISADFDSDLLSLRLSRPPSREGGSGWRPRSVQPTDARVLNHLKKFQERDDTEFIADSISVLDTDRHPNSFVVAVDEKANIRITRPRSTSGPARQEQNDFPTHDTQDSGGTSTGRTLHTASTRKSENVGTLAPDAVAHLIGDHVGGMTFDKESKTWVRVKGSPQRRLHGSFLEPVSNITSDDDPFREISDLPVDEVKEEEIRRASQNREILLRQEISDPEAESESLDSSESLESSHEEAITEQEQPAIEHPTSELSHGMALQSTAFGSSQQPHIETRATSWSDGKPSKSTEPIVPAFDVHPRAVTQPAFDVSAGGVERLVYRASASSADELPTAYDDTVITRPVELHDSIQEASETSLVQSDAEGVNSADESVEETNNRAERLDAGTVRYFESPRMHQATWMPPFRHSPIPRSLPRQVSLRRKTLTGRLNADALEKSELSFIATLPGERTMSVSLSVSRPASSPHHSGQIIQSTPTTFEPSFMLSDLPDFTIHEEDHERPSERQLAQRLAQHAANEVNDRFAYAVKDIVRTLTDVQEDGPYWDDLKQLDLHSRSLSSLYGLDDFCAKIQNIDVSGNALTHLNGAPSSIRELIACSNQLSSLTSWTHLMNLQYLDISGNQLEDLAGVGCLIHLRELRADDNKITSLEGVQQLDSLLKLRVSGNQISSVDFENSSLCRLEELDLSDNKVTSVDGLENLPSLVSLHLNDNPLKCAPSISSTMDRLRYLSMQDCSLNHLDVSCLPSLRRLCIDGNCLTTVESVGAAKSLEILSMRRQKLPGKSTLSILSEPIEARTLRLSGNALPTLIFSQHYLCVQHLELASCGLQELPADFGLRMPNLQTLNLNFNALKDVRPLLNIKALAQLSVCGNLLNRLRQSIATFARMPALTQLDIRDNPLTQGFYAPRTSFPGGSVTSTVVLHRPDLRHPVGPTLDDVCSAAEHRDAAKYHLPAVDLDAHAQHSSRLDDGIALRRRVYHMLLADSCVRLTMVDGLVFGKAGTMVKDSTWDRLVELGIVKKSARTNTKTDTKDGEIDSVTCG